MSDPSTPSPPTVFCPHCSYNLSYTLDPRCPECGQAFDHSQLASSQLPWNRRKTLGLTKAYFRTLFLFCRHPRKAALAIASPPNYSDANRFRFLNITLAILISATAVSIIIPANRIDGIYFDYVYYNRYPTYYPFSALLTSLAIVPILHLAYFAALLAISWLLRLWFWIFSPIQKPPHSTLALYLTVWFPLLTLLLALDAIALPFLDLDRAPFSVALATTLLILLTHIYLLILFCRSTLTLFRRTTHCSLSIALLSILALPLSSLFLLVSSFLIFTYVSGLLALIFSSLFSK